MSSTISQTHLVLSKANCVNYADISLYAGNNFGISSYMLFFSHMSNPIYVVLNKAMEILIPGK